MKQPTYHGLLVLDKPGGLTSRDAVNRAQTWFPRGTRLGHTGTLDPLATGVLVLCVGVATRLAEYVQRMDKLYTTDLRLGATSDTDDVDGTVMPVACAPPTPEQVADSLMAFEGEVDQVPPVYSAAKVTGRRAYDLARAGQEVSLEPRRVHIYSIGMLAYDFPRLTLAVCCGKGTYIRSLARDLGVRLGCGAVVETLRRDSVGPFTTADAVSLDATPLTARDKLRPVRDALSELRWLTLKAAEVARMRQGQTVPYPEPLAERDLECAVFDDAGALRAIARWDHNRGSLVPLKVLSTEY